MKCIENYLSQEHSIPIPSYTIKPTIHPTKTCPPSNLPSDIPTLSPTNNPSIKPTKEPSNIPTLSPTNTPSNYPTNNPSSKPSTQPSNNASTLPNIYQNLTSTNYPTLPSLTPTLSRINNISQTSSISPPKSNTKIIHIFHLDALKIITLAIALLTSCICSAICCLIGALIYKREVDKISKIKKTLSEQPISLPPIIPEPTKGEMVAYSEHSDSEGNMVNTGDINNKTPNNLSKDIHKRVSSNATELLYQCHTTKQ